jgi:DNA repair protein RadD
MPLSNDDIAAFFQEADARIAQNPSLREPQAQGHAAAAEYFGGGGHRAVEQIPVGCGKTGLIAILPFGVVCGRVLVIAPNLTIRDQIADAVDATNPRSFYRSAGVLRDFSKGPYRATLDATANVHDANDAHIVVTNIQQLAEGSDRWLEQVPSDYFDLIIVDEGHHNAAPSWQNAFAVFPIVRPLLSDPNRVRALSAASYRR